MRLALRYTILSGLAFVAPSYFFSLTFAQERCGTVEYSKTLHPNYELHKIAFEKWMSEKRVPRSRRQPGEKQTIAYKIPVVVHVIHNGEPIGTGANISEAQVLSQIRVLNEDFTRQNADAASTPAEFAAVAGSLDIEFVLAKQNPDGLPTDGIVRINGGRSGWTINDNYTLKSLSYWPAEQYMNIWVCNLSDQYVGYAQHPESDLEGLENSSTNRLTDGLVIWHRAFGSSDDGPFSLDPIFNKGRTTTHEAGHFFGLFHVWGDDLGACSGSDYVADTPNQGNRTQGCPAHPRTDNCGQVVMFQNFLDYTDDQCMNLFTEGQVERMSIVIENSPRRSSLLASPALEEPDPLPNDIGIRTIIAPDAAVCSNEVTPVIEVRNYGSNLITSVRIRFLVDGVIRETLDFPLSLDPEESVQVAFGSLSIPSGSHDISFEVLETNGTTDASSYNDVKTSMLVVPVFGTVPFEEDFDAPPAGWITQNFDGQITWAIATAPSEEPDNKAIRLNYFNYEDKIGEIDVFLSPVFDLSSVPAATLSFDVAHARYQSSQDRLKVMVLTNCEDIFGGTTAFNKAGDTLKTAPSTTSPFTPANENHWRKEFVDLSQYVGMDKVQIAFVGINDWGNNIFIDNIALVTEATQDIALVGLAAPSVVTCNEETAPGLLVENKGSLAINDITIEYSVDNGPVQTTSVSDLNLLFRQQTEVLLPTIDFGEGPHTLHVTLKVSEAIPDRDPSNNEETFIFVVNNSRDRIPLREDFEDDFTPIWTVANPSAAGGMNWETIQTTFGDALYFNAFNNTQIGHESWFVSPVLDFSRTTHASMVFDISYRPPAMGLADELVILASADCGETYEQIAFEMPDKGTAAEAWVPTLEAHWSRNLKVDLSSFAGGANVRVAFVARNQHGNNLYLDNIEFFVTSNPNTIELQSLYSIYGYNLDQPELTDLRITFNLPERQDVRLSLVNTMGQIETDGMIGDVLNQTYPLGLGGRLPPGVYVIRLQIGNRFYSSKVLVP